MRYVAQFTVLAMAIFLVVPGANAADEKSDVERLQGHWVAVSGEVDGKALEKSELAGIAILFEGKHLKRKPDTLLIVTDPKDPNEKPKRIDTSDDPYDFNVDATKVPKELNVEIGWSGTSISTPLGSSRTGKAIFETSIYSIDQGKLTICWCWGGQTRPKGFATKPSDGFTVIVYERARKAANKELRPTTPAR